MTQMPLPGMSTRMANTQMQAKRLNVGNNPAAVNALRDVTGGIKRRPKSQVSGYQGNEAPAPITNLQPAQPVQQQPQQPQQPMQAQQPLEDPVATYNRNQALDHIISSPEMMDAVTKLKLRNHFKGRSDEGLGMEALDSIRTVSPLG